MHAYRYMYMYMYIHICECMKMPGYANPEGSLFDLKAGPTLKEQRLFRCLKAFEEYQPGPKDLWFRVHPDGTSLLDLQKVPEQL